VKIELKRRLKPLKVDQLIDQGHPLFIGKILSREAGYEHDEVGNRLQYIEKHLEPPLISSSYQSICGQYAGAAIRPVLQGVRPAARRKEIEIIEIRRLWSQQWNKAVSRMDFTVLAERKDYEHTSATEFDRPPGWVRRRHRAHSHVEIRPIGRGSWRSRRRRVCVSVPPLAAGLS